MTDTAPTKPTTLDRVKSRVKSIVLGSIKLAFGLLALLIASSIVLQTAYDAPKLALSAAVPGAALAGWLIFAKKGFVSRAFAAMAVIFSLGSVAFGVQYYDGTRRAKEEVERIERERVAGLEKAQADAAKAEKDKKDQAEAAERKKKDEAEAAERKKKEEAEAAEKAKRDAAELLALRKTNPDKFLRRLKDTDPSRWRTELAALRPKEFAAYQEQERREQEAAEAQRQRKSPKDYLTLDFSWNKGGFGSIMVADFTIKSRLLFSVQDITILCTTQGNSGTKLSVLSKTLYEIIPAKGTKRVADVNLGFMDSQSTNASCSIVAVKTN